MALELKPTTRPHCQGAASERQTRRRGGRGLTPVPLRSSMAWHCGAWQSVWGSGIGIGAKQEDVGEGCRAVSHAMWDGSRRRGCRAGDPKWRCEPRRTRRGRESAQRTKESLKRMQGNECQCEGDIPLRLGDARMDNKGTGFIVWQQKAVCFCSVFRVLWRVFNYSFAKWWIFSLFLACTCSTNIPECWLQIHEISFRAAVVFAADKLQSYFFFEYLEVRAFIFNVAPPGE